MIKKAVSNMASMKTDAEHMIGERHRYQMYNIESYLECFVVSEQEKGERDT